MLQNGQSLLLVSKRLGHASISTTGDVYGHLLPGWQKEAAIAFACRVRLGRKELIHFQEVQLMVAQMIADTATIRSLVWQTARTSPAPRQDLAAICKFQCTDTAVRVAESAMELMSNHGMLHANRAEKVFRDARLTQIFEGTNQINRLAVIEDQQERFLAEITQGRR